MSKSNTDWTKVKQGARVVVKKFAGLSNRAGSFLAVAGGHDSGKLRIALDEDDKQYREIKETAVSLECDVKPKTKASGGTFESVVQHLRNGKEVTFYDGTVIRFDGTDVIRKSGNMWVKYEISVSDIFLRTDWRKL